jgi:hypothetical protein
MSSISPQTWPDSSSWSLANGKELDIQLIVSDICLTPNNICASEVNSRLKVGGIYRLTFPLLYEARYEPGGNKKQME